jgi:hypothetical protein
LAPAKFQKIKTNYKVGDGREEKSVRKNVVDLVYSKKEETKYVSALGKIILLG